MKKLIVCTVMFCMCATANANINYGRNYEMAYKNRPLKSVRKIIKEIIYNRKKTEKKPDIQIMPIPLYDSLTFDQAKNLA